jgi:hypothetical protein
MSAPEPTPTVLKSTYVGIITEDDGTILDVMVYGREDEAIDNMREATQNLLGAVFVPEGATEDEAADLEPPNLACAVVFRHDDLSDGEQTCNEVFDALAELEEESEESDEEEEDDPDERQGLE